MIVLKDCYKWDVYRMEFERDINNPLIVDLEMSNIISWDVLKAKMTVEELRGLADFINKFLENPNE